MAEKLTFGISAPRRVESQSNVSRSRTYTVVERGDDLDSYRYVLPIVATLILATLSPIRVIKISKIRTQSPHVHVAPYPYLVFVKHSICRCLIHHAMRAAPFEGITGHCDALQVSYFSCNDATWHCNLHDMHERALTVQYRDFWLILAISGSKLWLE